LIEALGYSPWKEPTTAGYSASRKTTIDVTNLIVPQASIRVHMSLSHRRPRPKLGT